MKRVTVDYAVTEGKSDTVEVPDDYGEGEIVEALRELNPFADEIDAQFWEEADG